MKIDEAAFAKAMSTPCGAGHGMFRKMLENYLAALPTAEPGRDRIAVVTAQNGAWGIARFNGHAMDERDWRDMEADAENLGGANGPFTRAVIRCTLLRPAEPVEVEGSVEVEG